MTLEFGFVPQVFLLVLIRVAAIVGMVSFFGGDVVPTPLRMAMCVGIALALTPVVPAPWHAAAGGLRDLPSLTAAAAGEILQGALIGLVCELALETCGLAGEEAALQSGLSMAAEVDPVSGASSPIFANLLRHALVLCVLLTDGHLALLRLVGESLQAVPPCGWHFDGGTAERVTLLAASMFETGMKLAAPVVATALVVNMGFGLMARLAPDFNILFLSLPVRLLAGFFAFGVVLQFGLPVMGRLVEQTLANCAALLAR
jgi:flagellar biosynthesis protein FliR